LLQCPLITEGTPPILAGQTAIILKNSEKFLKNRLGRYLVVEG